MTKELERARAYETAHISTDTKPAFHLTAPTGWMNDPNGFSFYKGEYHLFYQYYPYADHWGPMHWGHSVTKDFIHWTMKPAAIAPDCVSDREGCFSGGAVTAPDGRQALIYTGCRWDNMGDHNENVRQRQCIALGDGTDYEKIAVRPEGVEPGVPDNVVFDSDDLPEGFSREDFRDPKVWQDGDVYRMVTVSRAADGLGQILEFHSKDLLHWTLDRVAAHNDGAKYGIMWECPDLLTVDGRKLYIVSGQDMHSIRENGGMEFFAGDHAFWFFADEHAEQYQKVVPSNLDYGFDFYATQSVQTQDGRVILLAWMQNWDTNFKPVKQTWNGQMSLPRELSVRDDVLYQRPVRELDARRRDLLHEEEMIVEGVNGFEGVAGRILDLELTLSGTDYSRFTLHVANDEEHDVAVIYDRKRQTITVDRSLIGSIRDIPTIRTFPVHCVGAHEDADAPLKLRVVMDRFSAEIFVNGGAQTFSMTYYTPLSADGILLESDGRTVVKLDAYQLEI